jgi:hypothetical protein
MALAAGDDLKGFPAQSVSHHWPSAQRKNA